MRLTHDERWGASPTPRRRKDRPAQGNLAEVVTWGGRRKGAGRKPPPGRPNVRHLQRPAHARGVPAQITLRRAKGLPSLRTGVLHALLKRSIAETRREDFRIVHYSVQHDHVHLIVEADDQKALSTGMRSFAIRASKRVNRDGLRRKRGAVWGDRYHRRDLPSPTEVRYSLVYVLANGVKHGVVERGTIDPCTSGPWFEGWVTPLVAPIEPRPTEPPSTWLLRDGWSDVHPGFLFPSEAPKAAARPVAQPSP